jgi:hypothetical protein
MTEPSQTGDCARESIDGIVEDVHRRARGGVPTSAEVAYTSKFLAWEARSSVRAKPRRVIADLTEEEKLGRVFFPTKLVPAATHPLVRERGDLAVRRLLVQRLHCYLMFTSELEQMAVNPVAQRISRGRLGLDLPGRMLRDAYKICTDESWHAQVSDDLQYQIQVATGIAPRLPTLPRFMERLQAVCAPLNRQQAELVGVFFTIISETLISAILADIPRDPAVLSPVRELVTDHAIDEGRHHAYFSQLLEFVWPQLSKSDKATVAMLIPELVLGFLEPDYAAISCMLADCGLGPDETKRVIAECYCPRDVQSDVRQAAAKTIDHLRRCDVLEDPRTVDAFERAGLIGPESAAA